MAGRSAGAESQPKQDPIRVRFDAFELDEANASLVRSGSAVALAPTPFAVLCALVRKRGTLLTANTLLDEVWGHQHVSDSVLRTAISELRTALDDDARQPRFIQTVSRRGYRFIADATDVIAAPVHGHVAAVESLDESSFIGRAEPLCRLHAAWDRACNGNRAVVWVAGEPGIGKTTLIEQFVAGVGDIACARGQCVAHYGTGEPYLPLLEALAGLCRSDATLPALLRAVAPGWLLQLPWLSTPEERETLRRELAGVSPDRMLREMGELLDRLTERRPLLLITEDLHWSDRATIQLIDFIARRRGAARLMWLASFRLAEVVALDHPLDPLRRELRVHRLCEEIVLDPFSEAEVADYIAGQSTSMSRDEAFVRALHSRTDGVPLFVASVVSEVMVQAARGHDDATAASQLANVAVPENLTAIIDHYIAKLPNDEREMLSAAAVCGIEFRVNIVADVVGRDPVSVGQVCDDLGRQHLWLAAPRSQDPEGSSEMPYAFRHALFREVLYERTAPAARAKLHRKVGAALERERASGVTVAAAELAVHFERGREPMNALRYYAEAADAALVRLSPAECFAITEHALALLEDLPETAERDTQEIALATLRGLSATHVLGISLEAQSAFKRAYELLGRVPDHPMRGRLLNGFGFVLCLCGDYEQAHVVAERAEALSSEVNDPELLVAACIAHGQVDQLQGRSLQALTWIERGLAAADSFDAKTTHIFVADPKVTLLGMLAMQLLSLGRVQQGLARLEDAQAHARRLGQPMTRLVANWYEALFQVRLDNPQRVAALADDMRGLVDEFALAQGGIGSRGFHGWAATRSGEPHEGYRQIKDAYEDNTRLGMVAGGSEVRGYAAEALFLSGDLNAAEEELAEALRFANMLGERVYVPQLLLIESAIARARGERAKAQRSVRSAITEARSQEAPWLELVALLDLCEYGDATADDRHALAALVDALPEANGTTTFIKARTLLDRAGAQ